MSQESSSGSLRLKDPPYPDKEGCCGCCGQELSDAKHWVVAHVAVAMKSHPTRTKNRGPFYVHSICWADWYEENFALPVAV